MTPCPKPTPRPPAARKRIPRTVRPRQRSSKRASVEVKDAAWSLDVRQPCGFFLPCARCFIQIATDAHHIRGKKAHPELRHDLANGVALCRWCHESAHAHPRKFKAWLLSVRPEAAALWETPPTRHPGMEGR